MGGENKLRAIEMRMSRVLAENKLVEYFVCFVKHVAKYYLRLNEKSHGFKVDSNLLPNLINKYSSNDDKQIDSCEVASLFKRYKEQNKAFAMSSLTKQAESSSSIMKLIMSQNDFIFLNESADAGAAAESNESNNSNQMSCSMNYQQKDSFYRYKVWSNRMINFLLMSLILANNNNINNSDGKNEIFSMPTNQRENMLGSLAEIFVVLNSCSTYCQCAGVETEQESQSLFCSSKRVNEMSVDVLTNILNLLIQRK